MKIQEQKWHDFTRLLITTNGGSVQVELFDTPQDFGGKVYLYALWVDEHCRCEGIAKALMECVHDEIKQRGHKSVTLEWKKQDTPVAILQWYERLGYEQKSFDGSGTWALMVKEL